MGEYLLAAVLMFATSSALIVVGLSALKGRRLFRPIGLVLAPCVVMGGLWLSFAEPEWLLTHPFVAGTLIACMVVSLKLFGDEVFNRNRLQA